MRPPDVHMSSQPEQSLKSGGVIGSPSILLPSSMRNRDTDAAYLAEIFKRNPEILGSGLGGAGFDIHKLIGKLPRPKKGITLPDYNYAGPYNPLDKQLKFDPNTGEILEIYQQPTGKTDKAAMVYDVEYSLCGDDKKCKNEADRKMVKALDSIPWGERQWGHAGVRNTIAAKQKLGLGVSKALNRKNLKRRRVRRI